MSRSILFRRAASSHPVSSARPPLFLLPRNYTNLAPCLRRPARATTPRVCLQPALVCQQRMYAKKKGKAADNKKGGKKAPVAQDDEDDEVDDDEEEDREDFDVSKYAEDMKAEVKRFKTDLDSLRIGRVNPALLESVVVTYKGSQVPLARLAQINIKDAQTLMILMNEEEHTSTVDKSIRAANLGLNPQAHAPGVLRVPIPKFTAEYKAGLLKKAAQDAEKARHRVRTVRLAARGDLKGKKNKHLPEDTSKRLEKELDTMTKNVIADVDKALAAKTKDVEKA
ncbi:hypothetical protein HKX48_004223 [Thoreauomyces humboldtii]|nr:hypothetical protein HKX48_004223 [Thoreauomyces humboldtii]